jgi:hypothetical protein
LKFVCFFCCACALYATGSRHHRRTRAPWNESLEGGFVLDFAVNAELTAEPEHAMAELKVDMEESGDWFGGGHLMKQHWPLNLGCWEAGLALFTLLCSHNTDCCHPVCSS